MIPSNFNMNEIKQFSNNILLTAHKEHFSPRNLHVFFSTAFFYHVTAFLNKYDPCDSTNLYFLKTEINKIYYLFKVIQMIIVSWKKQKCHSAWNKNYGSEFRTKVRMFIFPLVLMFDLLYTGKVNVNFKNFIISRKIF